MSNIYIQEPPTSGKVLLSTTAGDIDIELWSREAPKACRNFIQLCMEGYYDGTTFHRLIKEFIVQGGDPTGTGEGGESCWGGVFKDEFHSRLRFTHRGLVAMANSRPNDNGSQFFFTLSATPELQNKHTIFGKVVGDTIFNMVRLGEGDVGEDDRPLYPHKITSTRILNNPFDDITPREFKKPKGAEKKQKESAVVGTKNLKLLSFGDEEEEDEEEHFTSRKSKSKSSHDLLQDPKLSGESLRVELPPNDNEPASTAEEPQLTVEGVREKLKAKTKEGRTGGSGSVPKSEKEPPSSKSHPEEEEEDSQYYLGKEAKEAEQSRLAALKSEYKSLRREFKKKEEDKFKKEETEELQKQTAPAASNSLITEYNSIREEYKSRKATIKKDSREQDTLAILEKFKNKLEKANSATSTSQSESEESAPSEKRTSPAADEDEIEDDSWLSLSLHYDQEKDPVLAKDANLKSDDWFEIYDPRNPLNKRRRKEESGGGEKKKRK